MSTISEDVESTSRDTSVTVWGIAAVVMLGSMASAGVLFHQLGEHPAIGVLIALAVDLALAAWLRVGNRLKTFGITSGLGFALEFVAAAMTLFINVGAALSPLVPEHSPLARGLLAVMHGFLPVIMVLVSLAGGDAYLKLRRTRDQEKAREQAARDAETQRARSQWEADQARENTARKEAADRAERERKETLRGKEIDAQRHQREMADRREQRDQADRQLAAALASVMFLSVSLRGTRGRRRQSGPGGAPRVRQPASPAARQGSPAGRQGSPPGRRRGSPQVAPDVAELATLAKTVLEQEPGIGRTRLARELGVNTYRARQALEHIEAERAAAQEAELQALLDGGR